MNNQMYIDTISGNDNPCIAHNGENDDFINNLFLKREVKELKASNDSLRRMLQKIKKKNVELETKNARMSRMYLDKYSDSLLEELRIDLLLDPKFKERVAIEVLKSAVLSDKQRKIDVLSLEVVNLKKELATLKINQESEE